MPYHQWTKRLGENRWYLENGKPRVYTTLDYQWKPVYDFVCKQTDMAFHDRIISDIPYFTDQFLFLVPGAWLKFKTSLEMFLGSLTGININPQEFYAGFERWTTHDLGKQDKEKVSNSVEGSTTSTSNNSATYNYGAKSGDTKARQSVFQILAFGQE